MRRGKNKIFGAHKWKRKPQTLNKLAEMAKRWVNVMLDVGDGQNELKLESLPNRAGCAEKVFLCIELFIQHEFRWVERRRP